MSTLSEGERRRAERIDRDDLNLNLSRDGKPLRDCQLRDATTAGLGIQVGDELKPGEDLSVELTLPDGPLRGRAVVVWCQPFHMGFRAGLKLESAGFLGRSRLRRTLTGVAGPAQWLDRALFLAAAGLIALVAADLYRSGRWHALASKLTALTR